MDILAMLIAILALGISILAFARTSGVKELRSLLDEARETAANALDRLEDRVRRSQKQGERKSNDVPGTQRGRLDE